MLYIYIYIYIYSIRFYYRYSDILNLTNIFEIFVRTDISIHVAVDTSGFYCIYILHITIIHIRSGIAFMAILYTYFK